MPGIVHSAFHPTENYDAQSKDTIHSALCRKTETHHAFQGTRMYFRKKNLKGNYEADHPALSAKYLHLFADVGVHI